ncbi:MAG: hypothetical protein WC756_14730 [Taibaiella sp.]
MASNGHQMEQESGQYCAGFKCGRKINFHPEYSEAMEYNDDQNRRIRSESDGDRDIKATVKAAQSFIEDGIMCEQEALKYFNLPKVIYDKFKVASSS